MGCMVDMALDMGLGRHMVVGLGSDTGVALARRMVVALARTLVSPLNFSTRFK